MSDKIRKIDLDDYRRGADRVFSGRDYGIDVRNLLNLDAEDHDLDTTVLISVPSNVLSLNISFFLGLFGESVRALRDCFDSKYQFECTERIRRNIQTGKRRAVISSSVLELCRYSAESLCRG